MALSVALLPKNESIYMEMQPDMIEARFFQALYVRNSHILFAFTGILRCTPRTPPTTISLQEPAAADTFFEISSMH